MRIFQVGFNRCGTRALTDFFEVGGLQCIHWDSGRLAQTLEANQHAGLPILTSLETFDFYADMEYVTESKIIEAYRWHRTILDQVADSKFILNVRDVDDWVASRLRHPGYASCYERYYDLDRAAVVRKWRHDWHEHHAAVRDEIPPDRLLVFDVSRDDPVELCDFAELPRAFASNFTQANESMSVAGRYVRELAPVALKKRLRPATRARLIRSLRRRSWLK